MRSTTATLLATACLWGACAPTSASGLPVPASHVPGGLSPSTPREDWDACDGPRSLQTDSIWVNNHGQGGPPQYYFYTFQLSSDRALRDEYNYAPGAPEDPYQPWPAYVTCVLNGPLTVPTGHTPFRYSVTITNVSHQDVSVAWVANTKITYGKPVPTTTAAFVLPGYSIWATAKWYKLAPGQSHVFLTRELEYGTFENKLFAPSQPGSVGYFRFFIEGFWLIKPQFPAYRENFTEWVPSFVAPSYINHGLYLSAASPTGDCRTALVPGSAVGIASSPNGGYWVLSSTGHVAACHAPQYGDYETDVSSMPGQLIPPSLQPPIPGNFLASALYGGYWVLNQYDEVLAFGHAHFYGQDNAILGPSATAPMYTTPPIPMFTAITAAPDGDGYWILSNYGHVYPYHVPYYGSADFKNAVAIVKTNPPEYPPPIAFTPNEAIGLAPTDGGKGYVIVTRNGKVAAFGKARACPLPEGISVAGIAPDYRTGGYWVATTDGTVFPCGAPSFRHKDVTGRVVGIAGLPNGLGYRLVTAAGKVWCVGDAVWYGNPN